MIETLIVFCCVLGIVISFDTELRFRFIFTPKGLLKRTAKLTREAPRLFFALGRTYLDFRIKFENSAGPLPNQFILVSNHQSLLDIAIIFFYFSKHNVRFIAKKELGRGVPFISQLIRYQHHCLIDRDANRMNSMKSIDSFAKMAAANGWSPVVFPEGTRWTDGRVHKFHTGGVRRLLELNTLPIVLVALNGGWRISHVNSLLGNARGTRYSARVLRIYDAPKTRKEATGILEAAQQEISEQIRLWNEKYVLDR